MILLGDFNSPPGSPPIQALGPLFIDSLALLPLPPRGQARKGKGFYPLDPRDKHRIDYIFLNGAFTRDRILSSELFAERPLSGGLFCSDHFGVLTTLRQ